MTRQETQKYLSKSQFVRGMQCHKSLYLHQHKPKLRDKASAGKEARFRSGHDVGRVAQNLFPGGLEIPYEELSHEQQIQMTSKAIEERANTLYEGAFSYDGVFIKADILHRVRGGWELYEVKSTTKMKDVYYDDAAIQYYVLAGTGLKVKKVCIVYLNSKYVRRGEIDVQELFTIEDITDDTLGRQAEIRRELGNMRRMLRGAAPDVDIGKHCNDPNECDFIGTCWAHITEPSVFDLRERGANKYDLYTAGIIRMKDIDLDVLSDKQRMQVESYLKRKDTIKTDRIKGFLASLEYPLSFLDFETFFTAVPMYNGLKPYQQVPFQFSLHRIDAQDKKPIHFEHLVMPGEDPRKQIAEILIEHMPDKGSILAYNATFEINRIEELAGQFPRYRTKLTAMIKRFKDPMSLFKERHVYFWRMQGSYSIKVVLPLMIPELRYEDLDIQDGTMAMDAWFSLSDISDRKKFAEIRESLLKYCKLDTYGLIRILHRLQEISAVKQRSRN